MQAPDPVIDRPTGYNFHSRWRHEPKAFVSHGHIFFGRQKPVFGDGIVFPFGDDPVDAAVRRQPRAKPVPDARQAPWPALDHDVAGRLGLNLIGEP